MALVRWDPLRELEEVGARLDHFFGRVNPRSHHDMTNADWAPACDISETDREYLVKAELAAIDKNDVKVEVENGALRIHGERRQESEEKGTRHHRIERSYGSFVRSFSLPDDVDGEKINADFKDGILTVHLPKAERPKTMPVEVKVT